MKKGKISQNLILGDFNWNDITRQAYWQIKMDKFDVQGTDVTACDQSDGCQVIIDSGTLLGMFFVTKITFLFKGSILAGLLKKVYGSWAEHRCGRMVQIIGFHSPF